MRILQLIQTSQLRGAELFASQLSNHLEAQGHEVLLVSLFTGQAKLPFHKPVVSLEASKKSRFVDLKGWRKLSQLIREFKPDIVQSNAGDTLKFAVMSRLLYRWKTPLVYRNANKVSDFITSRPKFLFNKSLVQGIDHVISVSELCRQDFIKTYGFTAAHTAMVPIGIEPKPVTGSLPDDLAPYFTNGKVLVNVASLVPEKNHQGLIRIMESVVKTNPDVRVIVLGDGKLRPQLEQEIQAKGLTDNVILAGYRNDVLAIVSRAHGFVLPSRIEGLPGVILEAFYCKVPVIAYNVGGISEVVRTEQTGWLINKNDEQGFADAIRDLLRTPDKAARMVQNAFNLVSTEFVNAYLAEKFAAEYRTVMKRLSK